MGIGLAVYIADESFQEEKKYMYSMTIRIYNKSPRQRKTS
jgi:uncharacterized protein affecting Mg2+/Co2+ transport